MDIEKNKEFCLIGYSGHSYVISEIIFKLGYKLNNYCDIEKKDKNPYNLNYLGDEITAYESRCFDNYIPVISVGSNNLRKKLFKFFKSKNILIPNIIHPNSNVHPGIKNNIGLLTMYGSCINSHAKIGHSVVCNTNSVIEHECEIGNYVHIAPSATLCGNVKIGDNSFVGANSVINPGIIIGKNVIIGSGSVVTKNISNNQVVYGNPAT